MQSNASLINIFKLFMIIDLQQLFRLNYLCYIEISYINAVAKTANINVKYLPVSNQVKDDRMTVVKQ